MDTIISYITCIDDTSCFKFSVLLTGKGKIWGSTQSIEFSFLGYLMVWDNPSFLIDLKNENLDDEFVLESKKELGDEKYRILVDLLQHADKMGWMIQDSD